MLSTIDEIDLSYIKQSESSCLVVIVVVGAVSALHILEDDIRSLIHSILQ